MKSLCTTCKHKAGCDEHRRCYGYPNYRVKECKGYEPKDDSQVNDLIRQADEMIKFDEELLQMV